MNIAELQAYGMVALTIAMSLVLYGYIYHLYKNRKDVDGVDYEQYSNMALNDDIGATPVAPRSKSDDKEK